MFWKNAAWSWDDAAGDEDDDGGFLLAADLRRTPDSAPDTDLTWTGTMASTTRSISNAAISCGPKETTRHSMVSGRIGSQEPDQGNYSGCVSSGFCGPQHAAVSTYPPTIRTFEKLGSVIRLTRSKMDFSSGWVLVFDRMKAHHYVG